jgi:hypothetical protein
MPIAPRLCHSSPPNSVDWVGEEERPHTPAQERARIEQRKRIGRLTETRNTDQIRCSATTFTWGRLGDLNPGPTHYASGGTSPFYEGIVPRQQLRVSGSIAECHVVQCSKCKQIRLEMSHDLRTLAAQIGSHRRTAGDLFIVVTVLGRRGSVPRVYGRVALGPSVDAASIRRVRLADAALAVALREGDRGEHRSTHPYDRGCVGAWPAEGRPPVHRLDAGRR